MIEEVRPIDEMPHLKARLGKAKADRIRYVGQADTSRQKHATNVTNTVLEKMQYVEPFGLGCPITDILTGVSWMDQNQAKPLSVDRLFNLFQCIQTINTREIMKMMNVDKRQAQRYLRAARIALPHLENTFSTN